MDCAECGRLTAEKDRLRHVWATAIGDLTLGIGRPSVVYAQLVKLADTAHYQWQDAVFELNCHIRGHENGRVAGPAL